MSSDRRLAPLLFAALLAGCGELAGPGYHGAPLLTLEGTVDGVGESDLPLDQLEVAVFWTGRAGEIVAEQAAVVTADFPARYTLSLFHPPPDEVLLRAGASRVAVGHPLLYVDHDGDGRWSQHAEPLVGGSLDQLLLYAETTPFDPRAGGAPLRAGLGFQRLAFDAPPCGDLDRVLARLEPERTERTDLGVGNMWPRLQDWDCDPASAVIPLTDDRLRLDPACPPSADLVFLCDHVDAPTDPFLSSCLDAYCPILADLRDTEATLGECPPVEEVAQGCDGTLEQPERPDPCAELVCDRLGPDDRDLEPGALSACPDPEALLQYCEYPGAARRHGVDELCLRLYCPPPPKAEEAPPEGDDDDGSSPASSAVEPPDEQADPSASAAVDALSPPSPRRERAEGDAKD